MERNNKASFRQSRIKQRSGGDNNSSKKHHAGRKNFKNNNSVSENLPNSNYVKNSYQFLEGEFEMVATTLEGLENLLCGELENIGAKNIQKRTRAIVFAGGLETLYRANLQLRTALKVLKPIFSFRAKDEHALYDNINKFEWDKIFDIEQTFAITSSISSQTFTHSQYASLKAKDAIADYFRTKYGSRPDVNRDNPDFKINLHIYENNCEVSLDSSGEILNHRGYRQHSLSAPINECLASAMLMLAGYNGSTEFIDPMCGSGTLAIEAAFIARNIAPGLLRDNFAFMNWNDFDENLYSNIYDELIDAITEMPHKIYAFDISVNAIKVAKKNAEIANVGENISFGIRDFFKIEAQKNDDAHDYSNELKDGMIILNPPYDSRMKNDDITEFYKKIGDSLKANYIGKTAWVISSNIDALKSVGLATSRKIKLYNGALVCKYVRYDLYKGSKKQKYNTCKQASI